MTISGVRQVVWSFLGVVSQGFGRLATNVLVGRVGGATVLGSMATVLAIAQILVTLWPGPLGSTGVKFVAQARGRGDSTAIVTIQDHLTLRSLQGCLLLGTLGGVGWALAGGTWQECVVAAVVVLALGTSGLVQGLLYAERRNRTSSLRETAAAVFSLALVAALLVLEPDTPGAVLALPLAIGLLVYAAVGWPRRRPRSMGRRGRELDVFTLTAALGSVSSQGFIQLSVVAAASVGRESAGQFAVALALCTPLTLVITPLGLALFPAVNEAVGRGDATSVRRQITVATRFLAYAMAAGAGCVVLCREPIVDLVWGPEFEEAARVFIPLVAASAMGAVALPSMNGMASGAQRSAVKATTFSIVSAVAGILSWIVLVPLWGAFGVAVGLLLGRALFALAVMRDAQRLHGLESWWSLLARVVAIVVALVAVDEAFAQPFVSLVVFVPVGLAVVLSDAMIRDLCRTSLGWGVRR